MSKLTDMDAGKIREYFLGRAETDGTYAVAFALMCIDATLTDEGGVGIAQNLSALYDLFSQGTASIVVSKEEAGD